MTLKQSGEKFVNFLFYIYLAILILFVSMKFTGDFSVLFERAETVRNARNNGIMNANFDLFKTIRIYWKLIDSTNGVYLRNLIGNIIPFIPMGMLEAVRFRREKRIRGFCVTMFHCLFIILCIEVVQLITGLGYFDVDDILLNMAGCIIGYVIYCMFRT